MKIKDLGLADYQAIWSKMVAFTQARDADSSDEIWLVEHPSVFTLGRAGKVAHILDAHDIPIVHSDRGGQVTYHAPGQLIVYCLINLKRLNLSIREMVCALEHSVIVFLQQYGVEAYGRRDAPGVYVNQQKIASIGLRVSRGFTFHGLSLNVDMDLRPFSYINPCGMAGLQVTSCRELNMPIDVPTAKQGMRQQMKEVFAHGRN